MTTDRETAEVIRSWMKEPTELSDAGVDRVLAQVPDTPQHRYQWLPPFPTLQWRTRTMFSASKYLVAGVIVALFGGLLYITLPTNEEVVRVAPAAESPSPVPSGRPAPDELASLRWPDGYQSDGLRACSRMFVLGSADPRHPS